MARTLKMVAPTKDRCKVQPCYEHGHLVQVRVEAQINNQAGSLGDGITRYKDKGYKLAVNDEGAMICAAQECNEWAEMENGKYTGDPLLTTCGFRCRVKRCGPGESSFLEGGVGRRPLNTEGSQSRHEPMTGSRPNSRFRNRSSPGKGARRWRSSLGTSSSGRAPTRI